MVLGMRVNLTILIPPKQEHGHIFPSVCVIFDFFHQGLTVFEVGVFCLLRYVYSLDFHSHFSHCYVIIYF